MLEVIAGAGRVRYLRSAELSYRTMSDSRAELARALALQKQGRTAEAFSIYHQVLRREPRNGDVLHLMGIALARLGRAPEALQFLAGAVAANPSNPVMQTNLGSALNELGRHADAVASFERAVSLKPDFAAAYRGLGLAQMRLGRSQAAVATLQKAIKFASNDAQLYNDLGVALEALGNTEEALRCFERAVALNPRHAEALHNCGLMESAMGNHSKALARFDSSLALIPSQPAVHANRGNALRALGRPVDALKSFDQALTLRPDDPKVHLNRGLAWMSLENWGEAATSFDRALALDPAAAATHLNRGKVLLKLNRAADALGSLERAASLDPQEFEAHFHLGVALGLLGRHGEALKCYERAASLKPDSAELLNNRGASLGQLFHSDEALDCFERALRRNPDLVEAHVNAGNILKSLKRFDESARHFERAVKLKPDDAAAAWGYALLKLTLGDFKQGWALHESRLRLTHLGSLAGDFGRPRWTGAEPVVGKTVIVHAEQGLGDTLQFCRYVELLEARGATVILKVQPVLIPLLRSLAIKGAIYDAGQPLPDFDYHCPLLSLPLAFGTDLSNIPSAPAYLRAEEQRMRRWKDRLGAVSGFKVGLNWQGNPDTERQPWVYGRSFALDAAEPLMQVEGVSFVSLQRGPGSEQLLDSRFQNRIRQFHDPYDMGSESMSETAALVASLDLVVTSDTALAHLAGALGVPVWVLLHTSSDWRWFSDRSDSPWYPTMRLFRQRVPGAWKDVFEEVSEMLKKTANEGFPRQQGVSGLGQAS